MSGAALRHILYVEDDPVVRTMTKISLELLGRYTVRACASGLAALHAAQDFQPDLILLDAVIPVHDGVDTLAQLRRLPQLSATPVVFLAARSGSVEVARRLAAVSIGVLPKPVDPARLTPQLRALWERRPRAMLTA